MRRKLITFITVLACAMLVMKLNINATSGDCGSTPPACNSAQVVILIQFTNATIPIGLNLSPNCNPNTNGTNTILKDLSNILLSSDEKRYIKVNIDYEKSTCADQAFIIKCPSYGTFNHADVTSVTGVIPLHVNCLNANFVTDINRTLSITVNKDENFTIKATLEICNLNCVSTGSENRVVWLTTTPTLNVDVSNTLVPVALNYNSNNNQACVPVYTCY